MGSRRGELTVTEDVTRGVLMRIARAFYQFPRTGSRCCNDKSADMERNKCTSALQARSRAGSSTGVLGIRERQGVYPDEIR